MRKLTRREEVIMDLFWEKGDMFVKDLQGFYPDPKPHVNTLSTQVRHLEEDGFLSHKSYGNSFRYHALVSRDYYKDHSLSGLIRKYFDNSYLNAVSTLVRDEKISVDELKDLIEKVEKEGRK